MLWNQIKTFGIIFFQFKVRQYLRVSCFALSDMYKQNVIRPITSQACRFEFEDLTHPLHDLKDVGYPDTFYGGKIKYNDAYL